MNLKKRAEYIHPMRNYWPGLGCMQAGPYGEKACECCSVGYLKDPEKDILCKECEELCRGKEWCPV